MKRLTNNKLDATTYRGITGKCVLMCLQRRAYAVSSEKNAGMHSNAGMQLHADVKFYLYVGDEVEVSHFAEVPRLSA
jgi:hypothetical protein